MAEVPDRGKLEQGESVFFSDRAHPFGFFHAVLNPAFRAIRPVVAGFELVAWQAEIAVKHAAIIHHAGHHFHPVFFAGGQCEAHRPGFERIENEHRPVDHLAEALEATHEIERESIRRTGRDAEHAGETLILGGLHRLPQRFAGVAEFVRIVQHEQIKMVAAAAFELLACRHADESRITLRPAQFRIGETRIAASALPLAFVKIMPDHADQAVAGAIDALERAA